MDTTVTTDTDTREAVTVPTTKRTRPTGAGVRGGGGKNGARGPNNWPPGDGGGRNWNDGGGDERWTSDRYRIGMWVGIASILMLFTALTSAYIVRAGLPGSIDWRPSSMPSLVWLSTGLIIASSVTISAARKSLKRGDERRHQRWLLVTLLLGLGFVGSQLLAWKQLVAQGVYLASNPHSSFFYVLTGLHGVHILGGILALSYVLFRGWHSSGGEMSRKFVSAPDAKRQTVIDVVALYWHFMDGLWVYLFLLLLLWR